MENFLVLTRVCRGGDISDGIERSTGLGSFLQCPVVGQSVNPGGEAPRC